MSESLELKVSRFIEFNRLMIKSAIQDHNLDHQGVPAKVLLCSILDSLSKSRFSGVLSNGKRFISMLDACSDWEEKDHVSLLHLARAFEIEPHESSDFSEAKVWISQQMERRFRLSNRLLSVQMKIANDPSMGSVLERWPKNSDGSPKALGGLNLSKIQHKSLLWSYRNSLVHEYRIPGRGAERRLGQDSSAYYQQVSAVEGLDLENGLRFSNRWELIYPTGFFRSLAEHVLQRVAEFHLLNGSCPFAAYSQGSYWIPAYNDEF
ncbi:hypothetical protein [Pseudomonas aeruginosa]|uniref:hypothetical protein n=1 Tax=Pseudomonas aeruginosa TaxID=287 RepID=UPI000F53C0D1|nr:hypothetical protein [Pseudomonas aeruginosa]